MTALPLKMQMSCVHSGQGRGTLENNSSKAGWVPLFNLNTWIDMNEACCIVMTTYADEENGRKIIEALLAERLAACVQVMPMQSCYRWQGRMNCAEEKLVLIKTKRALFAQVRESILANHAYEMPEIVQVPIQDGSAPYLNWIAAECR